MTEPPHKQIYTFGVSKNIENLQVSHAIEENSVDNNLPKTNKPITQSFLDAAEEYHVCLLSWDSISCNTSFSKLYTG